MPLSADPRAAAAPSELEERLSAMLRLESTSYRPPPPGRCLSPQLSEWRYKIAEWSYGVVDHFHYDREAVYVALNILDRYLAARAEWTGIQDVEPRVYYLAATTALFLSMKMSGRGWYVDQSTGDVRRTCLRLGTFVELSRGKFKAQDIEAMELKMLAALRWRVHPPTPMAFVTNLLNLFPASPPPPAPAAAAPEEEKYDRPSARTLGRHAFALHALHELSMYLAELSVCAPEVSAAHPPSSVAFAAVLSSLDCINESALSPEARRDFLRGARRLSSSTFDPHADEIRLLLGWMGSTVSPESLSTLDGGDVVAQARDAGLLNCAGGGVDAGRGAGIPPPRGGSPGGGDIDAADDDCGRSGHRGRQGSAKDVMEGAARTLLEAAAGEEQGSYCAYEAI